MLSRRAMYACAAQGRRCQWGYKDDPRPSPSPPHGAIWRGRATPAYASECSGASWSTSCLVIARHCTSKCQKRPTIVGSSPLSCATGTLQTALKAYPLLPRRGRWLETRIAIHSRLCVASNRLSERSTPADVRPRPPTQTTSGHWNGPAPLPFFFSCLAPLSFSARMRWHV